MCAAWFIDVFCRYRGDWALNKPHGYGVKIWPNDGTSYDGMWEFGKHSGKGTKIFSDGTKYVGAWRLGKPDGPAVLWCPNGKVYEITFIAGRCLEDPNTMHIFKSRKAYQDELDSRAEAKGRPENWEEIRP